MSTVLTIILISALNQFSVLTGTDNLVHLYLNGQIIAARHLEQGRINFYYSIQYEEKISMAESGYSFHREKIRVERYYIGAGQQIEEIDSYNYKELIRKYMPNAPELHKRLGKLGFRFENVQYMVQFYNKFK